MDGIAEAVPPTVGGDVHGVAEAVLNADFGYKEHGLRGLSF